MTAASQQRSYHALAPAKVNLGLFIGPTREDGRHELVTVMQSISLADELRLDLAVAGLEHDEILCPGLQGPPGENLAARAIEGFRAATGWEEPPVRLRIDKRIPVAAGLGGGSADAAAALRLARAASGLGDERLLLELAASLGADVPAQVAPGRWLARGAGEELHALADPLPGLQLLVLPAPAELSTEEVYAAADQLGLARDLEELDELSAKLRRALELGAPVPRAGELLHNDLQQAAVSLRPEIAEALGAAAQAGGEQVLLSGSGPTVLALFAHANAAGRVQRAAAELIGRLPEPIPARSVDADFGRVHALA